MAKKALTYQSAVTELEEILSQIEHNDLQIDQLSSQVKRASELISFCKTKLKTTEEEVEQILSEMDD